MKIPAPVATAFSRLLRLPPPPDPPPGDESTALICRASPHFLRYRTAYWLIAAIPLLVAGAMPAVFLAQAEAAGPRARISPERLGIYILGAEVLGLAVWWALIRLDYAWRWYVVTDRSLRIREGIWHVREMTVTFVNVQNLSIEQGPIQRLFGISDVRVDTAGGGGAAALPRAGRLGSPLNLHTAWMRGLDNADAVRTAIQRRLSGRRDAGLGDPEETASDMSATPAVSPEALWAAAAMLEEARGLHGIARRLAAEPPASRAAGLTHC